MMTRFDEVLGLGPTVHPRQTFVSVSFCAVPPEPASFFDGGRRVHCSAVVGSTNHSACIKSSRRMEEVATDRGGRTRCSDLLS